MSQQTRKVTIVNTQTGESTESLIMEDTGGAARKTRVRFDDGYAITFEVALRRLASDREITGTMHRIIAALMVVAPISGEPFPSQSKRIARLVGITPNTVQKQYGQMAALGLIRRPSYGTLAFNPKYFWRGPAERRQQALIEEAEGTIMATHHTQQKNASAQGAGEAMGVMR